jgi:hypothetical protein
MFDNSKQYSIFLFVDIKQMAQADKTATPKPE